MSDYSELARFSENQTIVFRIDGYTDRIDSYVPNAGHPTVYLQLTVLRKNDVDLPTPAPFKVGIYTNELRRNMRLDRGKLFSARLRRALADPRGNRFDLGKVLFLDLGTLKAAQKSDLPSQPKRYPSLTSAKTVAYG